MHWREMKIEVTHLTFTEGGNSIYFFSVAKFDRKSKLNWKLQKINNHILQVSMNNFL
jgi:hypothetical protein